MADVPLERQFHGTVALAILHLRRLAKSNDTDEGLAAARALLMIDSQQEHFMRECLELDSALQQGNATAEAVTPERLERLRACILSINSADPA